LKNTKVDIAKTQIGCLPSPRSLTVRILGFHPRDPGSIPGEEEKVFEPKIGSKRLFSCGTSFDAALNVFFLS
jgi:hypothetical protein